MNYSDRRSRLRAALDDDTTAIAYAGPNAQYVTGFRGEPYDRHLLVCLPPTAEATVVCPAVHERQVRSESDVDVHAVDTGDVAGLAQRSLELIPPGDVVIDEMAPYSMGAVYAQAKRIDKVTGARSLFDSLRERKDRLERERLREAAEHADDVMEGLRAASATFVGRTERAVACDVRSRLAEAGAERLSFPVIVASGPNAGLPSYRTTNRVIQPDEPLLFDFGGVHDGYAADTTRTIVPAGSPPDALERAHDAVRSAYRAGIEAVAPGVEARAVSAAIHEALAAHGYDNPMPHDAGHGIGIEAHEQLSIAPTSEDVLEPGMALTIEPGVYADTLGVRIETVVLVTEDGHDVLNTAPLDLVP